MNQGIAKEKALEINRLFYTHSDEYLVIGNEESIPIVLANMLQSTNSFTEKQLVYVYAGHWGMSERLKVLGKYRSANRLIDGHCDVKHLTNFRPKILFNPHIISKLKDSRISSDLFKGFLDPEGPYQLKVTANA